MGNGINRLGKIMFALAGDNSPQPIFVTSKNTIVPVGSRKVFMLLNFSPSILSVIHSSCLSFLYIGYQSLQTSKYPHKR
jgi:hypothetical protein